VCLRLISEKVTLIFSVLYGCLFVRRNTAILDDLPTFFLSLCKAFLSRIGARILTDFVILNVL
jgi:hypothetical protein